MLTRFAVPMIACAAFLSAGSLAARGAGAPAELCLARDGATNYQIVKPATPAAVDEYAAREFAGYLRQMTGAEFPVVAPDGMIPGRDAIFIGLSTPALKLLGPDPLAALKAQEHVIRCVGRDILLYGKGIHGNLNAVFAFMDDPLGWRWYSIYEHPVVPLRPNLVFAPFARTRGFAFTARHVSVSRGMDYYLQHGMNMGFDSRKQGMLRRSGPDNVKGLDAFVSAIPETDAFVHTLFHYIPPTPTTQGADKFPWLERRNYFETDPEYFSMWENGQRVPNRQLCFANPGLRQELTQNVLKHIGLYGGRVLIELSAMDTPGHFCFCPECKALETTYGGPGGPLYDYLIELCGKVATQHPQALIKTLAYRRSQTQKPPILPPGTRLPPNLVIDFAPIEDCYFADWTHPDARIQETYGDLQAWGRITTHLWAWLYPNPWGSGGVMPVGNIERNINNMRLMARAGVTGLFTDHNGYNARAGLAELQQYVLFKLMQDVDCDTAAVIREFTDSQYGPAAPLMRAYLDELEQGRKAMTTLPPGVTYHSYEYDDVTFPYLTVPNLQRWQACFDKMEALLAGQPERLLTNVRLVRRELDFATLWKWHALAQAFPQSFTDHTVYSDRIAAVSAAKPLPPSAWEATTGKSINRHAQRLGEVAMQDFITLILCGIAEKPLPAEFQNLAGARVVRFVPKYSNRRRGRAVVPDPDAAFGYGVPVDLPDLPFQFGFYQNDSKTHGVKRGLDLTEIQPGAYKVYKLGVVDISSDSIIWFSSRSWCTQLQVGARLYEPGAENRWEAHISLRFDGPTYGNAATESLLGLKERLPYGGLDANDLVLVDQIILVRRGGSH